MRVVVLGGGFGGLEVATRLSAALGDEADTDIVVVDRSDSFIAGAAHIDLLCGAATLDDVRHRYADFVHPGVRFEHSDVHRIDPARRIVSTAAGTIEADVIVIALGAELDVAATAGLAADGHEFYTVPGVAAARRALDEFTGGRIVIGVCGTPYKCPPAPSGATLAVHDLLVERGIARDTEIALVMPTDTPIPPSPEASELVLAAFAERGITWHPNTRIDALDPSAHVARTAAGGEFAYELFLGVPVHRAPSVVQVAGLCDDGWVGVDPATMETIHHGVYALGDIVDIGAPKAGVFAEAQAGVAAAHIIARHRGEPGPARPSDRGTCYLDVGAGQTNAIEVTFTPGAATEVVVHQPSAAVDAAKSHDAAARIQRWFPTA